MGIKNLFQIIKEEAPDAVKEGDIKNKFGRKVAIVCCVTIRLEILLLRAILTTSLRRMRMRPLSYIDKQTHGVSNYV